MGIKNLVAGHHRYQIFGFGKIDDIAFCNLTSKDVVRHPLVQKIVKAYEDYEKKATKTAGKKYREKGKFDRNAKR